MLCYKRSLPNKYVPFWISLFDIYFLQFGGQLIISFMCNKRFIVYLYRIYYTWLSYSSSTENIWGKIHQSEKKVYSATARNRKYLILKIDNISSISSELVYVILPNFSVYMLIDKTYEQKISRTKITKKQALEWIFSPNSVLLLLLWQHTQNTTFKQAQACTYIV